MKAAAKRAAEPAADEAAAPAPEPAQVFDTQVMAGPLKQLADAEAKADSIVADIASATADATAAADMDAVDAASKVAALIGGRIGGLQGGLRPAPLTAPEPLRPDTASRHRHSPGCVTSASALSPRHWAKLSPVLTAEADLTTSLPTH